MNFFKVTVVYNERHMTEDIFNDERAAAPWGLSWGAILDTNDLYAFF